MANNTIKTKVDLQVGLGSVNLQEFTGAANNEINKQLKKVQKGLGGKKLLDIDFGLDPKSKEGKAQLARVQQFIKVQDGILSGAIGSKATKQRAASLQELGKSLTTMLASVKQGVPSDKDLSRFSKALELGDSVFKGKSKQQVAEYQKSIKSSQAYYDNQLASLRKFHSKLSSIGGKNVSDGKSGAIQTENLVSTDLKKQINDVAASLKAKNLKEATNFNRQESIQAKWDARKLTRQKASDARLAEAKNKATKEAAAKAKSVAKAQEAIDRAVHKKQEADKVRREKESQAQDKRRAAVLEARRKQIASRTLTAHEKLGRDTLGRAGGVSAISALNKRDLQESLDYLRKEQKLLEGRKNLFADKAQRAGASGDLQKQTRFLSTHQNIGDRLQTISAGLKEGEARMKGFTSFTHQASTALRLFFRYAIAYGGLYKLLEAVTALTRGLTTLDERLHSIKAISAATTAEMSKIKSAIKTVSVTTQFDVAEIGGAAQTLAQAGVKPDEIGSALQSVALFASATNTTLETSADLISTMRNVFTDLTDRTIADQMTKAVNISKLTGEDLKTILSRGLQVAKAYNITSQRFLAATTVLKNAGIKASTVSTGLRQSILELLSPDAKTVKVLRERYSAIGEELTDGQIRGKFFSFSQKENPLFEVLRELKKLGAGQGAGKAAFSRIFDVRASNVINVLLKDLDKLDENLASLSVGGASARGAEEQMLSLNNSFKNLGASIISASDTLAGDFVSSLAEATRGMTKYINTYEDALLRKQAAGSSSGLLGAGAFAAGAAGFSKGSGGLVKKSFKGAAAAIATFATGSAVSSVAEDTLGSEASGAMESVVGFIAGVLGFIGLFKGSNGGIGGPTGGQSKSIYKGASGLTSVFNKVVGFFRGFSVVDKSITKVAGLLKHALKVNPILAVLTTLYSIYELYDTFLREEDPESKLRASRQLLSKTKSKQTKQKESFNAFDPNVKGSEAQTATRLRSTVLSEDIKLGNLLGTDKSGLSKISGDLGLLGTTVTDASSGPFKEIKGRIQGELGKSIADPVFQKILDVRFEVESAKKQVAKFTEEYLQQLTQLAGVSDLTDVDQAKYDVLIKGVKDGVLDATGSVVDQVNAIIKLQEEIAEVGRQGSEELNNQADAAGRNTASAFIESARASKGRAREEKVLSIGGFNQEELTALSDVRDTGKYGKARPDYLDPNSLDAQIDKAISNRQAKLDEISDKAQKEFEAIFRAAVETHTKLLKNSSPKDFIDTFFKEGGVTVPAEGSTKQVKEKFVADVKNAQQGKTQNSLSIREEKRKEIYTSNPVTEDSIASLDSRITSATKSQDLETVDKLSRKRADLQLQLLQDELKLLGQKRETYTKDSKDIAADALDKAIQAKQLAVTKFNYAEAQKAEDDLRAIQKQTLSREDARSDASIAELKLAADKLAVGSKEREQVNKEILLLDLAALGRKVELAVINGDDIDNAKKQADNAASQLTIDDARRRVAEQTFLAEQKILQAKTLTAEEERFKAEVGVLLRDDRSNNLQDQIKAIEGQIEQKNLDAENKNLTSEDRIAAKQAVKELTNEVVILDEEYQRLNSTIEEQALKGFGLDGIVAKLQQTGVTVENLASKVRDRLVGAFDQVGDALADAIVDGKDLLGSLREIAYETSRGLVKDFIKAKFKDLVLGPLTQSGGGTPEQQFGGHVTNFGLWVQRLLGTGTVAPTPKEVVPEVLGGAGDETVIDENGETVGNNPFSPLVNKFKEGFANLFTNEGAIFRPVTDMFEGIFGAGSSLFNTVTGLFSSLFKGAGSFGMTGGGSGSTLYKIASIGSSLMGPFMGGAGGLGSLFSGGTSAAAAASAAKGGIAATAGASYNAGLQAAGLPIDPSAFLGAATGGVLTKEGLIKGKGTATSDSNLLRVSTGEAVLNAKAVAALGVDGVNRINTSALKGSFGKQQDPTKFIAGTQSSVSEPPVVESSTRIVNVLDPSLAADYMESSAGEKIIVNAIKRNSGAVKQVIA